MANRGCVQATVFPLCLLVLLTRFHAPAWFFTMGYSLSEQTCSCMGSYPGATASSKSLLLRGFSIGCSFLQGRSACSSAGFSMVCSMGIFSAVVFSTSCREIQAWHKALLGCMSGCLQALDFSVSGDLTRLCLSAFPPTHFCN